MHALAARLHMPVSRLVVEVSGQEFARWLALDQIEATDSDPQAQALKDMGFQIE